MSREAIDAVHAEEAAGGHGSWYRSPRKTSISHAICVIKASSVIFYEILCNKQRFNSFSFLPSEPFRSSTQIPLALA